MKAVGRGHLLGPEGQGVGGRGLVAKRIDVARRQLRERRRVDGQEGTVDGRMPKRVGIVGLVQEEVEAAPLLAPKNLAGDGRLRKGRKKMEKRAGQGRI